MSDERIPIEDALREIEALQRFMKTLTEIQNELGLNNGLDYSAVILMAAEIRRLRSENERLVKVELRDARITIAEQGKYIKSLRDRILNLVESQR